MNDNVRQWLKSHGARFLWSKSLDNGSIAMSEVGGNTFLIRVYKGPGGEEQGWEVYINLDPKDRLTGEKALAALAEWVKNDTTPKVPE